MLNSEFCVNLVQCISVMGKKRLNKIMGEVKQFVKENWGSPFIIGFITLLLSAAVSLAVGSPYLAENMAVVAYFALVTGVILQIVCVPSLKSNLLKMYTRIVSIKKRPLSKDRQKDWEAV